MKEGLPVQAVDCISALILLPVVYTRFVFSATHPLATSSDMGIPSFLSAVIDLIREGLLLWRSNQYPTGDARR